MELQVAICRCRCWRVCAGFQNQRLLAEQIVLFSPFAITRSLIKVYENLSSERLLVMERFKGVPLTDLEGIRGYTSNPEGTLITALNTWSMSVMMAESFHAVSVRG